MKQSKLGIPSDIIGKVPKTKVSKQDAIAEYLKSLEQSKKSGEKAVDGRKTKRDKSCL